MRTSVTVNLTEFYKATDELAKQAGMSVEEIWPIQAASVVKTAMNRTKSWDKARHKLEGDYRLRAAKDMGIAGKRRTQETTSINLGIKAPYGRVFHKFTKRKGAKYPNQKRKGPYGFAMSHAAGFDPQPLKGWDMKDRLNIRADINEFKALVGEYMEGFEEKLYFSKRSWYDILVSLSKQAKFNINDIPPTRIVGLRKIKRATAADGHVYVNGMSKITGKASFGNFVVHVQNSFPEAVKNKLNIILGQAINARRRAIYKDIEKGVFADIKKRSKKYPFIKAA